MRAVFHSPEWPQMRTTFLPRFLVVVLPLACAGVAQAQAQAQKPGLWETRTTIKNPKMDEMMASMQAQLASMPPEQRQMMESMMAKQGVGVAGNAMTGRVCVSKDQAVAGGVPHTDPNCQQTELSRSGNSVKYAYTCKGKEAVTGTGEFSMDSPTSWRMRSVTDHMVDGKPEHVEMNVAGTWLSDDCGSVKPYPTGH
jgi:hypothetical protein